MKTLNNYKNFVNGRFLNEGIRITAGIVLPAIVLSFYNQLSFGLVMSLGALCVSVTDNAGPVHHRVNGMFFCNIIISVVSIIVCFAAPHAVFLGALILVFGFMFSMLTVYGIRISSVGIAALLIMILSLQTARYGIDIFTNALYILAGGIWYLLFSIMLYSIRPYKIIQQILGDFIIEIGVYFKLRSHFYRHDPQYEKTYQQLLQQQVNVQSQQSLLSEILFKTRTIVKESTHTGRVLLKIYIDATELSESIMTNFQDYRVLHKTFENTGILEDIQQQILNLANELHEIGIAVKSGVESKAKTSNLLQFRDLKSKFEDLRASFMNEENVAEFVSLGRIFNNLQHLSEKINGLHFYSSYDKQIKKVSAESLDRSNYATTADNRPALFFNNLNFKSNIFRHALRVAFALLIGYSISHVFNIGHSYWILLTVVVILKPAYSLTKKRNSDRLIGTVSGILIGIALLFIIKNDEMLLFVMISFMTASYVFLRTNYFLSVLMMTPYLVIFFHMLYPQSIQVVLLDRLIDTTIGSVIAFIASIFFVPVWEHESVRASMKRLIEASNAYFSLIGEVFNNDVILNKQQFRINRRDLLTELANVSDSFNRMLSEPKRFQKGIKHVHEFVVLSHILTSHFAALSYYLNIRQSSFRSADLYEVIIETQHSFSRTIQHLDGDKNEYLAPDRAVLDRINIYVETLLAKRRQEILQGDLETDTKKQLISAKSVTDQFNYIFNVGSDLEKTAASLNK